MKYGLLGEKLPHSHSPKIHGMLGNLEYNLEAAPDEVADFLAAREFDGINVTIPYKQTVMPLCDVLDGAAIEIGAVNTIANCGGKLFGCNTDFDGFIFMCNRAGIDMNGKKVLILGSGGTSLTARAVCKGEGAREYLVVSRKGSVNYQNISDHADADIIINTTPVGMYPDNGRTPVDLSLFPKLCGVVDVIYNPIKTELCLQAQKRNIPFTSGLPMLVAQAVRAHEYFFDVKVDDSIIEDVLAICMKKILNVIFVGMPGCGKSSIGTEYAKMTDRSFLDTDIFVEQCGMSIPDIFEKYGEEYFRDKETQAIEMLSAFSEKVIATGGGAIKREKNVELMKQNGLVVYLKRDLDKLSTDGRPLSEGGYEKIMKLYEERHELYENAADIVIETHEDIKECALRLDKAIDEALKRV